MQLTKSFDIDRPAAAAARIAARDDTLKRLFEGTRTEIVSSKGNRRTTQTHYEALGRKGILTFEFLFLDEGSIQFEKVCDGKVWRKLEGVVSFAKLPGGKRTRVTLHMSGNTKPLVPEIAIRGPMTDQIEQMANALRECLEKGDDSDA